MLSMPTVILQQIFEILEAFSNNSLGNISISFKIYIVNLHTAIIHR